MFIHIQQLFRMQYTCFELDTVNIYNIYIYIFIGGYVYISVSDVAQQLPRATTATWRAADREVCVYVCIYIYIYIVDIYIYIYNLFCVLSGSVQY